MSVGTGASRPGVAQEVERARRRPCQVHPPHDGAGLERVVRVGLHDAEGEDARDVLAGPGPAEVHRHAGLPGARTAQRAHVDRDERRQFRTGDPGRLADAAVLLGHREQLQALAGRLLPRPRLLVGRVPRQRDRGRPPPPGRTPAAPSGARPDGERPAGRRRGRPRAPRGRPARRRGTRAGRRGSGALPPPRAPPRGPTRTPAPPSPRPRARRPPAPGPCVAPSPAARSAARRLRTRASSGAAAWARR